MATKTKKKPAVKAANWAAIKGGETKKRRAEFRKMTKEGALVSNKNMRGKGAADQTRSYSRITNKAGQRVKKADMFTKRGKVRGGLNMKAKGGGQTNTTYSEEG